MTRSFAGVFDLRGGAASAPLGRALAPAASRVAANGPIAVEYTGPPADPGDVLCLLGGYLDNSRLLAGELGVGPDASAERLLATAWRRWGLELLPRLRGDFALVIWDRERGEGLLARDQFGIRSLFIQDAPGGLRFATEIRDLLALAPGRPPPDPQGVAHWIAESGRAGSGTLFAGIRRLGPGSAIALGGEGPRERRYWAPRFEGSLELSAAEMGPLVRDSIGLAVDRRLSTEGTTGVMMSGGLDSATIAAVAASRAPGRVSAYSAAFPDHPAVDESGLIAELRSALRLPGVTAEVRPGGLVASAVESVARWQLPLASWGDFWATSLLRAAAADGAEVMLGGDGGDELFGVRIGLLADRLRGGHPLQAWGLVRQLPGAGEWMPRRQVAGIVRRWGLANAVPHGLHQAARHPFAKRDAPDWLLPRTVGDLVESDDPLAWKRLDGPRWWAYTAHLLTRVVEEAGIFEEHRHRAAGAGLEARHPLFDLDLFELAMRQSPDATFDRHRDRPVLRAAMSELLPDSVRLRPQKARFDSVLVDSLVGPDLPAVRDLLLGPRAEIGAYVDLEWVRRDLLAEGAAAAAPFRWMTRLWRLITIECWLRAQGDLTAATAVLDGPVSRAAVELRPVSLVG